MQWRVVVLYGLYLIKVAFGLLALSVLCTEQPIGDDSINVLVYGNSVLLALYVVVYLWVMRNEADFGFCVFHSAAVIALGRNGSPDYAMFAQVIGTFRDVSMALQYIVTARR